MSFSILQRNSSGSFSKQTEKSRILLQYSLTLFFSFLTGCLGFYLLSDEYLPSLVYQSGVHFELTFTKVSGILEMLLLVFRYAGFDLLCVAILLLSSLTSLHLLISDGLLFAQGFLGGFALCFLFQLECSRTPPFANLGYFLAFAFFRLSLLGGFLFFFWSVSGFVMNQKTDRSRSGLPFSSKAMFSITLRCVLLAVLIFILTTMYTISLNLVF